MAYKRNRNFLSVILMGLVCGLGVFLFSQEKRQEVSVAPLIQSVPDVTIFQNSLSDKVLDLWDYTSDSDTPKDKLLFNVVVPNRAWGEGSAHVTVAENRYVVAAPDLNWIGEEEIVVEVNDGTHMDYDIFLLRVVSVEAGTLMEAEDRNSIKKRGDWMPVSRRLRDGLLSNNPGDALEFMFEGTQLAVGYWGKELLISEIYYRHPVNQQPWSVWKYYRPGKAVVKIDGTPLTVLDVSLAETRGWTEFLVSGLDPGQHSAEIIIQEGSVLIDRVRASPSPLAALSGSVKDEYDTPLADILVRLTRTDQPDFVFRTAPDGRLPLYYGAKAGSFAVSVMPDSAPGYFRPPNPEEMLAPQLLQNFEVRNGERADLDVILQYTHPDVRSLGIIRRPIGTIPALVEREQIFNIECHFPTRPASVKAFLNREERKYPLKVISWEHGPGKIQNGHREGLVIRVVAPAEIPEALYHLSVALDGREDTSRRAVKVLSKFKRKYSFIQISDLHIRSPKENRDREKLLLKMAEEANRLQPEFVVLTGDITDAGSRPEYLRTLRALGEFDVPTFTIPGNHDFYSSYTQHTYQGGDEYQKYLGQHYYDFYYGDDHYVLLNTGSYTKIYEVNVADVITDQWGWVNESLEKDKAKPEGFLCLISHWDYTVSTGEFYREFDQIAELFKIFPVDLYLRGHVHNNREVFNDETSTWVIQSGSLLTSEYRVIEIENSRMKAYPVRKIGTASR